MNAPYLRFGFWAMADLVDQAHHQGAMEDPPKAEPSATEEYELKHVHNVYDQIATHFSSTRFKPWPIVETFLQDRRPGEVGLDIGCGNGKYLPVNKDVFIVASDRSNALVKIASTHEPHSSLVADILDLPHRPRSFDFVVSIAVVHHLSTRERRVGALSSMIENLKRSAPTAGIESRSRLGCNSDGELLVYVWALEQKQSRRGWDKGDAQDVMVPWVLKSTTPKGTKISKSNGYDVEGQPNKSTSLLDIGSDTARKETKSSSTTYHRYYHLYREGELEQDIQSAGGHVLRSGYEKDNWWAIAVPKPSSVISPSMEN